MHSLITKLFEKRGIKSVKELSVEEKQTFENWDFILSEGEITVDSIKRFCESQISLIEGKWRDLAAKNTDKAELIPYHTVYKLIVSSIEAPKVARESLEKQLNELIK